MAPPSHLATLAGLRHASKVPRDQLELLNKKESWSSELLHSPAGLVNIPSTALNSIRQAHFAKFHTDPISHVASASSPPDSQVISPRSSERPTTGWSPSPSMNHDPINPRRITSTETNADPKHSSSAKSPTKSSNIQVVGTKSDNSPDSDCENGSIHSQVVEADILSDIEESASPARQNRRVLCTQDHNLFSQSAQSDSLSRRSPAKRHFHSNYQAGHIPPSAQVIPYSQQSPGQCSVEAMRPLDWDGLLQPSHGKQQQTQGHSQLPNNPNSQPTGPPRMRPGQQDPVRATCRAQQTDTVRATCRAQQTDPVLLISTGQQTDPVVLISTAQQTDPLMSDIAKHVPVIYQRWEAGSRNSPFETFCAAYPDYSHSFDMFVRACVNLGTLKSNKSLSGFLFDDFIRVFPRFVDYIKDSDRVARGRDPMRAFEWYHSKQDTPVYRQEVITRHNIVQVLSFYPAEVEELVHSSQPDAESTTVPEPSFPGATIPEVAMTQDNPGSRRDGSLETQLPSYSASEIVPETTHRPAFAREYTGMSPLPIPESHSHHLVSISEQARSTSTGAKKHLDDTRTAKSVARRKSSPTVAVMNTISATAQNMSIGLPSGELGPGQGSKLSPRTLLQQEPNRSLQASSTSSRRSTVRGRVKKRERDTKEKKLERAAQHLKRRRLLSVTPSASRPGDAASLGVDP